MAQVARLELALPLQALSPAKVSISKLETPSRGRAGEWQPLELEAHVEEETYQPGLAVGYVEGPADKVKVKSGGEEVELPKGYAAYGYLEGQTLEACRNLALAQPAGLLYPEGGSYLLRFYAGYVVEEEGRKVFKPTDQRDLTFTAEARAWWEEPWLFGIPAWQWIGIGGGLSVVAIAAGVVMYQERQREEMMMLMLAR